MLLIYELVWVVNLNSVDSLDAPKILIEIVNYVENILFPVFLQISHFIEIM